MTMSSFQNYPIGEYLYAHCVSLTVGVLELVLLKLVVLELLAYTGVVGLPSQLCSGISVSL